MRACVRARARVCCVLLEFQTITEHNLKTESRIKLNKYYHHTIVWHASQLQPPAKPAKVEGYTPGQCSTVVLIHGNTYPLNPSPYGAMMMSRVALKTHVLQVWHQICQHISQPRCLSWSYSLSFQQQISSVCRICYLELRRISAIRHYLSEDVTQKTVVCVCSFKTRLLQHTFGWLSLSYVASF